MRPFFFYAASPRDSKMLADLNRKFVSTASQRSHLAVIFVSTLLIILLCWLDYITGDYSLIVFYLIPISLTAWFVGRSTGLFFCFLSLLARIIADYGSLPATRYSTQHNWNVFSEFLFLIIMSLLISALNKSLQNKT